MKNKWLLTCFLCCMSIIPINADNVINGLLNRIVPGSTQQFIIETKPADKDYFELAQQGDKVVIRGNNDISIAVGINWYLKYYAGINLSWNNMQAKLPAMLPKVTKAERHETVMDKRYYLNYCTSSYSMAFWDWKRWEREIDWMALHGINLPLMTIGTDAVWYAVLKKLGYSKAEINEFIAGPAFQAWWLMNNLEGWGGPNPDSWYTHQLNLSRNILKRMKEYGIEPVLPGYSGMLPNNAKQKLKVNVSDPGMWCGFRRPAFLQPTDAKFSKIAELYYQTMNKLLGKVNYYSMDPFHEGGNTKGVDLDATGKSIMAAMKKNNPKAVWVIQAWGGNPRREMVKNLKAGDMLVLDLYSESCPQWGDPLSTWYRPDGFMQHNWLFCMLHNFGGNIGLYGKMKLMVEEYYKARNSSFASTMKGVGLTMEGIENNPVMYELLTELPWRENEFNVDNWVDGYVKARYGSTCPELLQAWRLLENSAYNCPKEYTQQGTTESVFCARPAEVITTVSTWAESHIYYDADDVVKAARLMLSVADKYKGNNNFEYDLVDVVRQAIADKARITHLQTTAAFRVKDKPAYQRSSTKFLRLLDLQDELLSTRPEFMVGTWLNAARNIGSTSAEKDLYEWNARTQITVWGTRTAAEEAGLRDYSNREWSGLLKDFYRNRWVHYFDYQLQQLDKKQPEKIDYFNLDEVWTKQHNSYPDTPQADVVTTAKRVFDQAGF